MKPDKATISNPLDSRFSPRDIDPGRAADPEPREPDVITVLQRLEHTTDSLLAAISLFARHMTEQRTPARRRAFQFTTASPANRDDAGTLGLSYAVLNPTGAVVYVGIGGDVPQPGAGAISVPPNSLLVLPLQVEDVNLAIPADDAALVAAGTAGLVVQTLRFNSVQPAFLGAI